VLDVESAWDATLTDKLLSDAEERYTSLILGSHHVVGTHVSLDDAVGLYRQCRMNDRAHGAKVVLSIDSNENDEDQLAYVAALKASKLDEPRIPNIGLILGEAGSYSRITNLRFTPVTHECLPAKAAPGQLTAVEIMAGRLLTALVPAEWYAILRHNIAYSVSPQMQGSAFATVKLPHTYSRADVETVEEFVGGPIWNDENFGGCSVTIPHKQNVIEHLDVLTDAAREIGSVNTVIVKKDKGGTRVLIGENTDWRGIYNPLKRRLGKDDDSVGDGTHKKYALILGGGGTARAAAYAARQLGLERIYFNRTPEKAADLATEFGGAVARKSGRRRGGGELARGDAFPERRHRKGGDQHSPRRGRVRAARMDAGVKRRHPAGRVRRQLQALQHGAAPAGREARVRRRAGLGDAVGAGRGTVRALDGKDGPVRRHETGRVGELSAEEGGGGVREQRRSDRTCDDDDDTDTPMEKYIRARFILGVFVI